MNFAFGAGGAGFTQRRREESGDAETERRAAGSTDHPERRTRWIEKAASPRARPLCAAAETPVPAEVLAQIGRLRSRIQMSVGQVVLAVMNLPRYRHQSVGDLAHLIVEPLLRDRLAIAYRAKPGAEDQADEESIAGFAIWASVSDAVDARLTDQVRAGVFPVRLGAQDGASGEIAWLLDVIAPDREAATLVLANFRRVAGDRAIKLHPIVARLVDPKVLERLRGDAA